MEIDAYSIGGAIFGVLAIYMFWRVYDYLVNGNPHALNLFGAKKYKVILLHAVEHKMMWEDEIYDGFMGQKSLDIYLPALRRTMKCYQMRSNTKVILGYRLDDNTIVDPFLMNLPIPMIYNDEFRRLVGDTQADVVIKSVDSMQIKPAGITVALYAAFSEYSTLLLVYRDRAMAETKKIASGTPRDLGQQIKDMAPAITVAVGITFFFIFMAMQSFGVQAQTAKMISAPAEAQLACQNSLASCQQGLLDILYGKNVTLPGNKSTGIFDVFGS